MDQAIISRDHIRATARRAFAAGKGRDDHGFNWHSRDAIATWQGEWDECAKEEARAFFKAQDAQLEAA
jgi:hypothetical protein